MPCDKEDHASFGHNMLGWPQLENGEPQELFGCESICLFCFLTVTGTRNKLVRHLKSCETFQTLAVRKKFQIKDSLFINRKIPRTGTPEEKYGPPIASDDPRHLRYKTSLNNNALFRSAKVQNLPFAAAVKTRFGIPTELQHVEGVASTRPHSKPTPGLPEFPAKLRSVQTSIVDALASGTARQSSKQGTYERSIQPMKPSSTPPQSRILRDRQKVVTRASSALAPGAPSTQHGVPPGLSEVQQYESLKNDKDRAVLEDERVDLKAAPSITASSPTSPSIARSSDLIPIEKEDVHNEGSVSARHQGLRVSTDDTAAGRLFSGEGSSHQTAIVTGPDTVDPSSCIVNAIAVNRTTGASSTTTRIDPPKAEHVDCRIEEGDQVQGKSIPHREQTPGPFQHRADDGSCSESGSDEVNRLEKQDADARVADLFIDIMSIVDGTEVEESQILDPCPPRAASADIERPTSVSAELFLQSGISSLPHAHQYSRVITNATNTVCPSNTFLAVNGEHAKPPPSSPRVPSQSRNDTVPTAQTKLPTPSTIPSKNRFLPLTSGPSNLELDFGFEQKVAAVLRSQVWQDSEWMRNVEDSLFTRLANRLKEDSGTGQMHVGTFSGTLQKRKYADTLSGESNQPDNSAPEVSHEPEKRIRLLDSAKGDGFLQGTHRESEAKDKLIESLQNENESYRAQVALLSERLKQLEGTGILQKVPLHEAATSGSDDSAPKFAERFKSDPISPQDKSVYPSTGHGNLTPLAAATLATSLEPRLTETLPRPDIIMGTDATNAARASAKLTSGIPSRQVAPATSTVVPKTMSSGAVPSQARPANTDTRLPPLPRPATPITTSGPITIPAGTPRGRGSGTKPLPTPTPTTGRGRTTVPVGTPPRARVSGAGRLPDPIHTTPTRRIVPAISQTITPSRKVLGPKAQQAGLQPAAVLVQSTTEPLHTVGLSIKAPITIPSDEPITIPSDDQEVPAAKDELVELYGIPTSQNDDTILKYLGMTEKDLIDETETDGFNCGFKALARSILGNENAFVHLRCRTHEEFSNNESFYMGLGWFEKGRSVEDLKRDILGLSVPVERNWYRNPIHTRMIANAFGGFIAVLEHPDAKTIHIYGPCTADKSEFFAKLLTVDEKPSRLYGICLVGGNHWKGFPLEITGKVKTREKLVRLHRDSGLNQNLRVTMNWDGHRFVGPK